MVDKRCGQTVYPLWSPTLDKDMQTEHELVSVIESTYHFLSTRISAQPAAMTQLNHILSFFPEKLAFSDFCWIFLFGKSLTQRETKSEYGLLHLLIIFTRYYRELLLFYLSFFSLKMLLARYFFSFDFLHFEICISIHD